MLTTAPNPSAELAANLLIHYSFDLSGYSASELVNRWLKEYPTEWLHLAVIEALYQGRYKAVSVQQILNFWQRRGQALYHFNMEFERLICSKFPESLTVKPSLALPAFKPTATVEREQKAQLPPAKVNNYQESYTPTPSVANSEEEGKRQTRIPSYTAAQPSFVVTNPKRELATATAVTEKPISPPQTPLPHLLPAPSNNPPIGQFTPQRSDRSESFTSKLKAMTVS
ncbi:MAG TPA: hypothetical protein VK203_26915 [Nostocaceae cyanobacterium]|nr:hypothetical protein [Nostocaceae cyanobacterium]